MLVTPTASAISGEEDASTPAKLLPPPPHQKMPAWLHRDGLVMAGVDWEPLLPRLRAGGFDLSQASLDYDEKIAIWRSEHSEGVARRLKEMGFNFVMIPLYKGGGLKAERASMEAAKQFTRICHQLGLRVGCYTFSGTILYEPMLAENPAASEWFSMAHDGKYVPYGALYFRRYVNRDHPGFRALARDLVRFAVVEARVDMIHFDNYSVGPSYEPFSVQAFREYLNRKYTPEQRRRRFGFETMDYVVPPPAPPKADIYNGDPLYQDFIDYRSTVMTDTYSELAEYARSLNPDVIVSINPGKYVGQLISSLGMGTLDHAQTIPWGGAFWDESYRSRMENGLMVSRFRSYMMGRYFGNMVFSYTAGRVAMAESMANNLQCLGCPGWVTGSRIYPIDRGDKAIPVKFDPPMLASVRFFREKQQYYRDCELVADVAVLNTYANTAYGPSISRDRWNAFTQAMYQAKIPFTLVPDNYPGDLSRFRVVVLPDLELMSDLLVDAVRNYVHSGGGLVITDQSARSNEHGHRRSRRGLSDLFAEPLADKLLKAESGRGRAAYVPQITIHPQFKLGMLPVNQTELLESVRWAAGGPLQVDVKAPDSVTMSYYVQPTGTYVLHLVNYDEEKSVRNIEVTLSLTQMKETRSVKLLSPETTEIKDLAVKQDERILRFTVPELGIYSMVIIG